LISSNNTKITSSYFDSTRLDVMNLLPEWSDIILEVGCGSGNTLEYLKRIGKCNKTIGIEINQDAAHLAVTKADEVYIGNIETMIVPLEKNSCDAIICLDVLEHLYNPEKVLSHLTSLLKPGGACIISLPNICNYRIIISMLLGKWNYTDEGLLDKTHIKFFSVKSSKELMNNPPLRVVEVKYNYNSIFRFIDRLTLGALSHILVYQTIIKSIKS